jgi:hypothetical protein
MLGTARSARLALGFCLLRILIFTSLARNGGFIDLFERGRTIGFGNLLMRRGLWSEGCDVVADFCATCGSGWLHNVDAVGYFWLRV